MKNTVGSMLSEIRGDMEALGVEHVRQETLDAINTHLNKLKNSIELPKSDILEKKLVTFRLCNGRISKAFSEAMFGRDVTDRILFESTGSIRMLDKDDNWEIYDDPFHISHHNGAPKTPSDVVIKYGQDMLPIYALSKAVMQKLMSSFPYLEPLTMVQIFAQLKEITGTTHFRGGYYNFQSSTTVGVSGSEVNETVKEEIFKMAGIEGSLDEVAEQFGCDRVDLLAGVFDELMARLISHERNEWTEQIEIVVREIKQHMKDGKLGLLC